MGAAIDAGWGMRVFGLILMILGVTVMIGTVIGMVYLAALGCAMNTTGCRSSMAEILVDLFPAIFIFWREAAWLFWLPQLAGAGMIAAGLSLRRRAT